MNESVQAIITVLSVLSTIVFAYLAFSRNKKQDDEKTGQHSGTVLTEIGYIKSGIDDIKHKQDTQDERNIEIISRLCSVEASAKQAHKRLDDMAKE